MMDTRNLLLAALSFFTLVVMLFIFGSYNGKKDKSTMHTNTVNTVIGDRSYIVKFGKKPDKNVPDSIRIRTHLQYVEQLLRSQPINYLSPRQKINRIRNLALLDNYIQAGKFPHNDGHPDPRRPVFMDEDGNICAVGYLLAQAAGHKMVQSINKKYKYAFIQQIDNSVFDRWARNSGFTKTELAMIQPTYNGNPESTREKENKNRIKTGYGVGSAALISANAIYLGNKAHDPWLFASPKINHLFGLAVGTGSALLGVLNLNNHTMQTTPVCGIEGPCWQDTYKETNHLRTAVSIANIGVGLVSITRAAYYLLRPQKQKTEQTTTQLNVTHLQTGALPMGNAVPAMQFRYNF